MKKQVNIKPAEPKNKVLEAQYERHIAKKYNELKN